MSQGSVRPTARTTGLVVKTVAEEVLVYDLETHRAHSVNRVAAAVWRQCDGTRDAAAIAASSSARVPCPSPRKPSATHSGSWGEPDSWWGRWLRPA